MNPAQQKLVQYLGEARASEHALVRVLQSQIAMTPRGRYRSALEHHLTETRSHADRVARRLDELGAAGNPLLAALGLAEEAVGQALAFGKAPLDLLRGTGGEEKVLKNAKDACATEALEIATYTAIAQLARAAGDDVTAALADAILDEEETMLRTVLREIPGLTDAVYGADVKGEPSYDVTTTGAADTAKAARAATRRTARKTATATKRTARRARKVPGVARAEGEIKGALADEGDLAIRGYDRLTAEEIASKLAALSQIELGKIDAYERRHENRSTVLSRIDNLRGDEPWPGYDELTASEIQAGLAAGDENRVTSVRSYERAHKQRAGVLKAADREAASA